MRLLVIGPRKGELAQATEMAARAGAKSVHAGDLDAGLDQLRRNGADLVLIDVTLSVPEFIAQVRSERILVDIVACGIANDARAAVAAVRAGAREYIPLPPDAELIAALIASVTADTHSFIYRDPAMARLMDLVHAIASSEASILITGDSGTGKEVVARIIHKASKRAQRPFVAINCAAIPEALLESELFGHEKGAFTGAVARRIGKFEEASGGTLLLDEISEMDIRLQAKLLRALQERRIDRVGGTGSVAIDIRILATSNRDMSEAVRLGTFREDLLFRLNVVNVKVPPLRERPDDIEALSDHFACQFAEMNQQPLRPLSDGARAALRGYGWPGNVRELENTIHRAVLLANGEVIDETAIVLPDGSRMGEMRSNGEGGGLLMESSRSLAETGRTLADVERDAILGTLRHVGGNRTHAANILGISIRTMRNKLNEYVAAGVAVPAPLRGSEGAGTR